MTKRMSIEGLARKLGLEKHLDQIKEDSPGDEIHHYQYYRDGAYLNVTCTAGQLFAGVTVAPIEFQKTFMFGVAAEIPNPGDSMVLEKGFDGRDKKSRQAFVVCLKSDAENVIELLITR